MDYFEYKNNELYAEDVAVKKIIQHVGSPCYIYSRATLERHWHAFNDCLKGHEHMIYYAVKANSNLAVLNIFARLGSGFDIVSSGELYRVMQAKGDASKVVFSGVGKAQAEMQYALEQNIHCFNIESFAELDALNEVAISSGKKAPIAIRVNPDVDAKTHPYISTGLKDNKFGVDIKQSMALYAKARDLPNLIIQGIACHIGSQLTEMSPFLNALDRVLILIDELAAKQIHIQHIDLGGGLGVRYQDETPPSPKEYVQAIRQRLGQRNLSIHIEPGRAITANAGILVTKVEYLKSNEEKSFAIVDAAMNDLLRPALYQSWQNIIPVSQENHGQHGIYDVVGPVCETGDFLGKNRELTLARNQLLAIRSAGAYGFTMSSNYNSRPRIAEVMVDGDQFHVVRKRETLEDLINGEQILKP